MTLYLYGIAKTSERGHTPTGEELSVVTAGELAALVRIFPEGGQPETEAFMKHAAILNEWADAANVRPIPLSTMLSDEDALRTFLKQNRRDLLDQLNYLSDKVQIMLQATWRENATWKEIEQKVSRGAAGPGPGKQDGISQDTGMDDNAREALRRWNHRTTEYLLDHLLQHTADHLLLEPELDRMMVNAAFLIDNSRLADFDDELQAIDDYFDNTILFQYTGPLPPFHFVQLTY